MIRTPILIVDDSEDDVFLFQHTCEQNGLNVQFIHIKNGAEAIRYLAGEGAYADRNSAPLPGLILLDLKMPKVDGFEVLQWLRKQPSLKRLIACVLTSSTAPQDIERAYECGANSYLAKPSSSDGYAKLAERVKSYWFELNHPPADHQPK